MKLRVAAWLLLPCMGALAVLVLRPIPDVTYRDVIVPVERIIEREPDTVRTFVDRIRTVEVAPRQVATALRGAEVEVAAFCHPSIIERVDTVEVQPDPRLLLRSVSHSPGWFWQRDRLLITGPVNTGDLRAIDYDVRPGYTVRTVGDSALVQYPRTALLRELAEFVIPAALGYAAAKAF